MNVCIPGLMDCAIDWGATAAMIGALATSVLAYIAFVTLRNAPKKIEAEFLARRKHERDMEDRRLAIDTLAAFEEGREAIKHIRSSAIFSREIKQAKADIKAAEEKGSFTLKDDEPGRWQQAQIVSNRIRQHKETWDKINSLVPVLRAVFGNDVKDLLYSLIIVKNKIHFAAEALKDRMPLEDRQRFQREMKEWTKIEEDPFYQEIISNRDKLEEKLRRYIRDEYLS